MTPVEMVIYAGGALLYALAGTLVLGLGVRLAGHRLSRAAATFALTALFVVFLGLHPFPDPATLDCSQGGARKYVEPFRFTHAYTRFWNEGRPLGDWLYSLSIVSPVMNVALFALPGMALARVTRSWNRAAVCAICLTGFIELSQITALYGLYPCSYRHFEIDDLILNVTGVMLGFALVRSVSRAKQRGQDIL
ncbi:VanZ family protein [Qingshengfaniella alkalisoli]|uniref:VanZ family protein n=1 Tax=Qingshengfaniella alkalisoli TaxID=2599296 RepID=A0A5B8J822_9RHOB|nr:VanZ family protein [Qingshengfaniella alkalisoli]QDY70400.1 VanZ family protein [Qingshengfaniella alkalisoli]